MGVRAIRLFVVFALSSILSGATAEAVRLPWGPVALLGQDAAIALAFAALEWVLRRWPRVAGAAYAATSVYAAVNVPVARLLSTPLSWPMLRAARGTLGDSIAHHVTLPNAVLVAVVIATAALLPRFIRRVPRPAAAMLLVLGAGLALLGPAASRRVDVGPGGQNALFTLAATALPRVPSREGARSGEIRGDWRESTFVEAPPKPGEDLRRLRGEARGRSVVLVLLESTGAQYLRSYGAPEDPMPAVTELSRDAIQFENAFCVYPESIQGLFSVIASTVPAIDTAAEVHGRLPVLSMAEVLARRGYRTGLFHSGRFAYLGMDAVVSAKGFEALEDAGDIGGEHDSSFGIDEPSTVRRILRWIDSFESGEPFFVTYLPVAGHHPYEVPGGGPFSDREEIGRYKNALHYADRSLAALIDGLRTRGLLEHCLLVLAGDHGEAFEQHDGNYGHTFQIYEENVHVPLLLVAPGLRLGPIRVERAASLLDISPTICDLLGADAPAEWQGSSLLDPAPKMAYFFTDYSRALLGLRDGRWKAIHDMTSGRTRLFDLVADPGESVDLAPREPERTETYRRRLLAACAEQRAFVHDRAAPRS